MNLVAWIPSGSLGKAVGQNSSIVVINYNVQKTDVIKCKLSPVILVLSSGDIKFIYPIVTADWIHNFIRRKKIIESEDNKIIKVNNVECGEYYNYFYEREKVENLQL